MKRRKVQPQTASGAVKSAGARHDLNGGGHHPAHPRSHSKPTAHRGGKARRLTGRFFPALTPKRVRFAFTVAVLGDVLQLALLLLFDNLAWPGQAANGLMALLVIPALGLHPLLLLAFALEFVPAINTLPMWTACVALVVALRKE